MSSTDSTAATIASPNLSISTSSSSTSDILQQQNSTQLMVFQNNEELIQALAKPLESRKSLHLIHICLDDDLIWRLIESNPKNVFLQKCHFDTKGSADFNCLFEFLAGVNSSKLCSRFAIQFKDCITQCILSDEFSGQEFAENEQVDSLLFILPSNVPQQLVLNAISSLVFLPSKSDLGKPLSSECKKVMKSVLNSSFPRLKHLLLKDMDFDDNIDNFVSISQQSLDLMYLWNCHFKFSDHLWKALRLSRDLIKRVNAEKAEIFRFTVRSNGQTTQIVRNDNSPLSMSKLLDLNRGLILSMEQDLPNDISLDSISLLTLFPSKANYFDMQLLPQSKQNLKSVINRQYPNLKHLILMGIKFDEMIENFIPISHLNLDSICLWNCRFRTSDPIWRALYGSMDLVCWTHSGKAVNFQFTIRTNEHTTRIFMINDLSYSVSDSPNLGHVSILSTEKDLFNGFPSDDVSLLTFFSSETDFTKALSPQSKKYLESVMNRRYPNLKHLILMDIKFDEMIENFIPISQLKLDLLCLHNCGFKTSDSIWSALGDSMNLVNLMYKEKMHSFRFDILIDGHITRIVNHIIPPPFMSNSPDLNHGLILSSEQTLPNDFSLDNISLLTLLPSRTDPSNRQLSSQSKQVLKSMASRHPPTLKCLLLIGINFDEDIEGVVPISQLKLDLICLHGCGFKTSDSIWSALGDSMNLVNFMHKEKMHNFRFDILIDGHITRVVNHIIPPPFMSNSPDLNHGLILPLGQALVNDLVLDNISFLVFIPSEADSKESFSSQSKQNLESITSRPWPNLKYLFLKGVSIDGMEEISNFVQKFKLERHDL